MTKTQYIFKRDNKDQWQYIRDRLETSVNCLLTIGNEDFQIEIKPYSKRSQNALAAYFVLIDKVVVWHPSYCEKHGGIPINKEGWRYWFEKEAGLFEEVDLMPIWEMKYHNLVVEKGYRLFENLGADFSLKKEGALDISLGKRFIQKTRSLSNKGDITKIEMERLINTVLEFGAKNEIPKCFIEDGELEKLLKFRGWKDE